jgi:hypothetical protein
VTLRPGLLEDRERYERVTDGWVDNTPEDALTHQVAKLPRERAERARGNALQCWQLDTRSWVDLPDSCVDDLTADLLKLVY